MTEREARAGQSQSKRRTSAFLPGKSLAGFVTALLTVFIICALSYRSYQERTIAMERVTRTIQVLQQLDKFLSLLKDAETGQRGFLLTGMERYLEPYNDARAVLDGELAILRRLLAGNQKQQQRLNLLVSLNADKMDELGQTIVLKRAGQEDAALEIVGTDRGKEVMDRIRSIATEMVAEEEELLARNNEEWEKAVAWSSYLTFGGSGILFVLILLAALLSSRDFQSQDKEVWLRKGQMALSAVTEGEHQLDQLGDKVLRVLALHLDAQMGAIYIAESNDHFRRFAGYALPPSSGQTDTLLRAGEGLTGQVIKGERVLHVDNVPEGYFSVSSSLGRGKPRHLLIAPAKVDGVVNAVVELGFFRAIEPADIELLERVAVSIGIAVRSSKNRTRLQELLEETQRQTEDLQAQQEELRVSNEELEEQSRALRDYQVRLQEQQAELETTNSQLEEQAQILQMQKDDLLRAQTSLSEKAAELMRSNQYKSEFLANMSHELRTPLNSTLILAQLLAENKDHNLTDEQVKFAQSIYAAGNDLLALINDILDLSKIEAGKLDIEPEPVPIARAVETLVRMFEPMARSKKLTFTTTVEISAPSAIQTDSRRLQQILKNLISNALKFTEQGHVSLSVFQAEKGWVCFAVRDTGIGIAPDHQHFIFEPFRQAEGSTHRKYGGTGLGLSISRDLARLLGGDILLESSLGVGSTFTLVLPEAYAPAVQPAAAPVKPAASAPTVPISLPSAAAPPLARPQVDDDRDHLVPGTRVILIIEDDVRFAAILCELAREKKFQCIVTHGADDGIAAALRYHPSAIFLDMNLPDHSGLAVLDLLKRNATTRHIPVHVISVADYSQAALELGAVGYAFKPILREGILQAFQKIEAKLAQATRRILIVDDDAAQRDSVSRLLANEGVECIAVATASEALKHLQTTTFDCMVLDLSLPDLSGYEVLEQMATQEELSFPPVIVYTGRMLSREEEHRLSKYSRSIIIKDVRSPERLLDEATLFLHQVESQLPPEQQKMLRVARNREAFLEGRRILLVEDDVRNIFALSSVLEPKGAKVEIARNGKEALDALARVEAEQSGDIDIVLMDIMMPEMDGFTAMREIRKHPAWRKLPIIALTAKAMRDDHEKCLEAGATDYIAKPLDIEKLLSLIQVWMPRR